MKKIFTHSLLTLASFLSLQAIAQTLTYANYSNVLGITQQVLIADNASFNTALNTTTGTGVTWNASGLTAAVGYPVVNMSYYSPSTTPYASTYTNSNYAQYDPALTSVMDYQYYNISADSAADVGSYSPNGAHEVFQNSDKRLVFPFAYGQSFTDSYAKTNYSNATTVSSNQTGMRTVNFNGYGTLTLPQGSFSNVGLISELRTNSLGPNSFDYTWIELSSGKTLMMYHTNNGSTTVVYTNETASAIKTNENRIAVKLFPNPASEKVRIAVEDESLLPLSLHIYNCLGENIATLVLSNKTNGMDIRSFAEGVYHYVVQGSGCKGTFIVE